MKRLLSAFALLLAIGCGRVGNDGKLVGGPCQDERDCDADARCLSNSDFPGGTCVVNCMRHEDCPGPSRCVDKEGGICLLECEVAEDCRGGYSCRGVRNRFGSGEDESLVCIE